MKKALLITFLVILVLTLIGLIVFFVIKSNNKKEEDVKAKSNFYVNVLALGDGSSTIYNGDSIYILAGDVDILIDAGPRRSSSTYIKEQILAINKKLNRKFDNKFEYVFASHMHQDHIAGFVGNASNPGLLKEFSVDLLIDNKEVSATSKATKTYADYVALRSDTTKVKEYKTADTYFTYDGSMYKPNKNNHFAINSDTTLDILFNEHYFSASSSENNNSVSLLFQHNNHKFLFTGDLEREGELGLVSYYQNSNLLKNVDFFKAGHHGSNTSNNEEFIDFIKPKKVAISCVAGSTEYTNRLNSIFPTQKTIDNFRKYTSDIFVTNEYNKDTDTYSLLNGTITCDQDLNMTFSTSNLSFLDAPIFARTCYVDNRTGEMFVAPLKKMPYYKKDEFPYLEARPFRV